MKAALVTDTISIPDVLATWRQHSSQASWGKPSIKVAKRNWQMSAETLTACKDHLPLSWKSEPDWRELLLRNVRGQYYKRIGLDRETLRQKPADFRRGVAYAAIHEPRYLVHRMMTGLTWNQNCFGNEEEFLHKLIQKWNVPWPPVVL
jgi:hypothetical protein